MKKVLQRKCIPFNEEWKHPIGGPVKKDTSFIDRAFKPLRRYVRGIRVYGGDRPKREVKLRAVGKAKRQSHRRKRKG